MDNHRTPRIPEATASPLARRLDKKETTTTISLLTTSSQRGRTSHPEGKVFRPAQPHQLTRPDPDQLIPPGKRDTRGKYRKYCAARKCEVQSDTHIDRVRLRKRIRDDVVDPLESSPTPKKQARTPKPSLVVTQAALVRRLASLTALAKAGSMPPFHAYRLHKLEGQLAGMVVAEAELACTRNVCSREKGPKRNCHCQTA